MKKNVVPHALLLSIFMLCFAGCKQMPEKKENQLNIRSDEYLLKISDSISGLDGYVNLKRDTIIGLGKYSYCFTDTFRTYAFVATKDSGIVAIDQQENHLYNVFLLDNGPDEVSDGLFRIISKNKIGYADAITGAVVISPQFDCAYPFENGVAQVSINCNTKTNNEHVTWESDDWRYIDLTGKNVAPPRSEIKK